MSLLWAAFGEDWTLNHKVTFDGVNREIIVAPGVNNISVKVDIYSAWKEWMRVRDNAKFLPALRTTGGDPTGNGQRTGDVYFLTNDWQVVVDQLVKVDGVLYSDNPSLEAYVINAGGGVISTVSSLSQSIEIGGGSLTVEQQLQLDKILQSVRQAVALSA